MLYWIYKKIKNKKLVKKLTYGKRGVQIAGEIECTRVDGIEISEYVYIGPKCKFYGRGNLVIGRNVIIGNNVNILTTNHNYLGGYDTLRLCFSK